jgi:hypothetical protein
MCRSIKALRRPAPRATQEQIEAASPQFIRKASGFRKPSKANQEPFGLQSARWQTPGRSW